MFRRLIVSTAAAAMLFGLAASAQGAEVTLKFSHFWPANSKQNTQIFQAWAKAVEKESNGRIAVQVFPSQTLTKADKSYQATVNGITDITATAQAYTAGRFPLSQIVELPPFGKTAEQGSCVLQKLYDNGALKDEYSDTHVLFMFTHGPGYLHTTKKAVRVPSDLKGLRIRRPTEVVAGLLKGEGASPVGMPAPEVYQSLQRGVIDGLTMPWEGMHVFRLTELTHHHLEVTFYRLDFVMTMNKNVYESLSPDLKKVIDDNSGLAWARKAGKVFDGIDRVGLKDAREHGNHTIVDPAKNPDVAKAWKPVLQRMEQDYIKDVEADGKPAKKVYKEAQQVLSTCQ